jgi:hypothetical protein
MVSKDQIRSYMQQHGCSFPEAFEALSTQEPTAQELRRALQTVAQAGCPAHAVEKIEAWICQHYRPH